MDNKRKKRIVKSLAFIGKLGISEIIPAAGLVMTMQEILEQATDAYTSRLDSVPDISDVLQNYNDFVKSNVADIIENLDVSYENNWEHDTNSKAEKLVTAWEQTRSVTYNETEQRQIRIGLQTYLDAVENWALNNPDALQAFLQTIESRLYSLEKCQKKAEQRITVVEDRISALDTKPEPAELKTGNEEDYYREWFNPMFLEKNAGDRRTLGECYVLPSYTEGEEKKPKSDLTDYIHKILENTDHTKKISLILGGPGAGKTTLFSKFLHMPRIKADEDETVFHYQTDNGTEKRIFLYRFNKLDTDIWKKDPDGREPSASEMGKRLLSRIQVEKASDLKDTILLLDGFDECDASTTLRNALLTEFAEEWGKYARIFITCRFHYLSDSSKLSRKVSCISLQNFAWEQQIREFICKYKNWDSDEKEIQEKLEKYKSIMDSDTSQSGNSGAEDDPADIYGIPIILYMVMAMEDVIDLREGITKGMVYDRIFCKDGGIYDRMINEEFYDQNTAGRNSFGIYLTGEKPGEYKARLMEVSREIAFYMFRKSCYQNARKSDIESLYRMKPFYDSNGNEVDFDKILSSGLFMIIDTPEKGNRSDCTLRFVHKSIYEYFFAEYIYLELEKFCNSDHKDYENLTALIKDAQVTDEIAEYLEQKIKDLDAFDPDLFFKAMEQLLLLLEVYFNDQAFQNLIYIIQCFRSAKEIKNKEKLLFRDMTNAKYMLAKRLRGGHFEGPGQKDFDLSYTDLSGLDLSHADLSYYDLTGSDASRTNFRYSCLDFCCLSDTFLKGAAFTKASLWFTEPSANGLFDETEREIPWTEVDGYQDKTYDLHADPSYTQDGLFLGQYRFGEYPQMTDTPEPILWDILEIRGNRALLWSHDILDVVPYNEELEETNWASCTLRNWLNAEFLQTAFKDEKERKRICRSLSEPHRNIDRNYKTDQGPAAIDRVFLLSGQELISYCADSESGHEYGLDWEKSSAIVNAYSKKAEGYDHNGYGWYWLRSVGFSARGALYVHYDGDVYPSGSNVNLEHVGVRPALWISLES